MPVDSLKIADSYRDKVKYLLLPKGIIRDRSAKLASDISKDYKGERVHLLCLLNGAHCFFTDLTNQLQRFGVLYTFEFIRVKSYDGTHSTGKVTVEGCDLAHLEGKNVIIIEDIVDTGLTLSVFVPMVEACNVKSLSTCLLCERDNPSGNGFKSTYCGFRIPNYYVIGHGFDCNNYLRDMEHAYIFTKEGEEYYKSLK